MCFDVFGCFEDVPIVFVMALDASALRPRYVVGSICGICASLNEEETHFKNGLQQLNALIKMQGVSVALRSRLRLSV